MWIKLLKKMQVDIQGKPEWKYPNDWIEVGNQTAFQWITNGIAYKPNYNIIKEYIDSTSGIVYISENTSKLDFLKNQLTDIEVKLSDKHDLLFSENLILNRYVKFKTELIPIGFKLLKKHHLAVPLMSYNTLAIHRGSEEERKYTKCIIKDLRVPTYNTDMMFIRRCDDTKELLELWNQESLRFANADKSLSFHRAYYQLKPNLYALPVNWVL